METRRKRSEEQRLYDFDFSLFEEFIGGDTIATSVVSQTAKKWKDPSTAGTPGDLTFFQAAPSGALAQCQIDDGDSGASYLLKVKIATTQGRTIVDYGRLEVEDVTE